MNSNYSDCGDYTYTDFHQEPGVDLEEQREIQQAHEKETMRNFLDRMYNKRNVRYRCVRKRRAQRR